MHKNRQEGKKHEIGRGVKDSLGDGGYGMGDEG